MAIRFIVRPSGLKLTADALKVETGAQAVVLPDELTNTKFNPAKDFLMGLPRAARVEGLTEGQQASYHQLRGFYTSSKYAQRADLYSRGVAIPHTIGISGLSVDPAKRYVVRPLSHCGGQDFVVTKGSELTYNKWTHYAAELFERTQEYRLLYSFGKRLCTIIKKMPVDAPQDTAWADYHEIGVTYDVAALAALGVYEALDNYYVCKDAHICGVDVMVSPTAYAVAEINFGPALATVPVRLKLVGDHLKQRYANA